MSRILRPPSCTVVCPAAGVGGLHKLGLSERASADTGTSARAAVHTDWAGDALRERRSLSV
jgi:hypothetical protein